MDIEQIYVSDIEYDSKDDLYKSNIDCDSLIIRAITVENTQQNIKCRLIDDTLIKFEERLKNVIMDNSLKLFGNKVLFETITKLYKGMIRDGVVCIERNNIYDGSKFYNKSSKPIKVEDINTNSCIECVLKVDNIKFKEDCFYVEYLVEKINILNYFSDYPNCMFR